MNSDGQGRPLPPPGNYKCSKKCKALQYCDSNEFIELTVGISRVLMSKAATNNICSNKRKAWREYTYVNTKTHQNRLKSIQPNLKNSFAALFVCKWGNHHATVLRIAVWPVGDYLFGAPSKSAPGARAPLAPPKGRPWWWVSLLCMVLSDTSSQNLQTRSYLHCCMTTDDATRSAVGLFSPASPSLTWDINRCIAAGNAVCSAVVSFALKTVCITINNVRFTDRLLLLGQKTEDSAMDIACD
jgi:hypothetical protein